MYPCASSRGLRSCRCTFSTIANSNDFKSSADDLKSLEFAIVENVQRHDLNPLEEAQGYKRLIDEFSYDQEKVSKFIGKSRSYITNSLRLLNLPLEVLNMIENKKLSAGHAKILVGPN